MRKHNGSYRSFEFVVHKFIYRLIYIAVFIDTAQNFRSVIKQQTARFRVRFASIILLLLYSMTQRNILYQPLEQDLAFFVIPEEIDLRRSIPT